MSVTFLTLTFRLPRELEGDLPEVLSPWPILGCEVRDVDGEVEVVVFMGNQFQTLLPQLKGAVQELGARAVVEGVELDGDWLGEYRQKAKPFPVGKRFWIEPHPSTPAVPPPGRLVLFIEPRQAFGTGSHESTQLMLLLLEELPPVGQKVLDVGTGSGILALAAKALGAARVVGFDLDPDAVFVARETAHLHPSWPICLFVGPAKALKTRGTFHLVMANMLVEQFSPLLPTLKRMMARGGRLFLSGLLLGQKHAVESELAHLGMRVVSAKEMGEWAALVAVAQ